MPNFPLEKLEFLPILTEMDGITIERYSLVAPSNVVNIPSTKKKIQ